ncbi:DUF2604 domain-containing protein [Flavisphingomonas formosensis]|uniref:DUF2604 domain-containing protein n=1 Tax=Flavisphingomonas formosensis TaxID=861534 RepID=UPI0012FA36CF|nr:DUF2604 domain-containing protein [Sphingomonas formosensis]
MTDKFEDDNDKCGVDEARVLREEAAALERDARELENLAHREEERAHDLEERARKIEEAHHHDCDRHGGGHDDGHPGSGEHGHEGKVKITVVVNGAPTVVVAKEDELLGDVRKQALEQTGNLAQPPESWELKNEAGEPLDSAKKVGDYHFGHEVTLFLSLAAGVAGA